MVRFAFVICLVVTVIVLVACDRTLASPTTPSPASTIAQPPAPTPGPTSPPRGGSDDVTGQYSLVLTTGAGCPDIPNTAKTRQYSASIDLTGESEYVVTLSGATFLTGGICTAGSGRLKGIGCDQFFASRELDVMQFELVNNNDEAHGGHIVEQIPPGTWLEILGDAAGRLDGSTITATGTATLWYCSTPSGMPFPCFGFVGCRSSDLQLTFTRR